MCAEFLRGLRKSPVHRGNSVHLPMLNGRKDALSRVHAWILGKARFILLVIGKYVIEQPLCSGDTVDVGIKQQGL